MFVRFVSTDYRSLILHVWFEDAGEVTSLLALLGRWWLTLTPDTPRICPRHVFSACCPEGGAPARPVQSCTTMPLCRAPAFKRSPVHTRSPLLCLVPTVCWACPGSLDSLRTNQKQRSLSSTGGDSPFHDDPHNSP